MVCPSKKKKKKLYTSRIQPPQRRCAHTFLPPAAFFSEPRGARACSPAFVYRACMACFFNLFALCLHSRSRARARAPKLSSAGVVSQISRIPRRFFYAVDNCAVCIKLPRLMYARARSTLVRVLPPF